jgi:plastocyanin
MEELLRTTVIATALLLSIEQGAAADSSHRFVQIRSASLNPQVIHIEATDQIGWLNYSSNVARVSFDREVGKQMVCTTRTSFTATGERLESHDIQGTQFASLCRLAPGAYTYRVDLRTGAGAGSGLGRGRRLEGRVIVE